ncbi:MAG TPA: hypothetical protein PK530_03565 [Anaerolineales bacterium]|nr:hypothetical protein [Anaerolineales bacterium]
MQPEDFFKQNVEMWEKFTTNYMDTMFKTVEKTMDQSQVFKEKVDKAVADTVAAQMQATLTALQALQRQVEMLNEKVDKMMEKE